MLCCRGAAQRLERLIASRNCRWRLHARSACEGALAPRFRLSYSLSTWCFVPNVRRNVILMRVRDQEKGVQARVRLVNTLRS